MDNRTEVREFLISRRAKLTPEQAGLTAPATRGERRVAGLRRDEVAQLANVSADYYRRLERGSLKGVSGVVLEALARALHLTEAERTHLLDLASAANTTVRRDRRPTPERVQPTVQRVLDEMTGVPAMVHNERLDLLAGNRLGRALYLPVRDNPALAANMARFVFQDPRSQEFYVDWDHTANLVVAVLRAEAGRGPNNRGLIELIEELCARGWTFRSRWDSHEVAYHRTGTKRIRHPIVGDLELAYEAMEFRSCGNLTLLAYTAQARSRSQDALNVLASWAATLDDENNQSMKIGADHSTYSGLDARSDG